MVLPGVAERSAPLLVDIVENFVVVAGVVAAATESGVRPATVVVVADARAKLDTTVVAELVLGWMIGSGVHPGSCVHC